MNLTDDGLSSTSLPAGQWKDALAARCFEQLPGLLIGEVIEEKVAGKLIEHVGDHQVGRRVGLLYHVAPSVVTVAPSTRKGLVTRSVRGLSRHASSRWQGIQVYDARRRGRRGHIFRPYARHSELSGADDRARTGDLDLGKVALYQLSYVRVVTHSSPDADRNRRRITPGPCQSMWTPLRTGSHEASRGRA